MNFDVSSFLIGLAALPTLALTAWVAQWLVLMFTLRSIAPAGCHVCDHKGEWELGERVNAAFHFDDWRHTILWANRRWHRNAWAAHRWNQAWAPGGEQHRVDCNQPGCQFLKVAGPYSDLTAAVSVGKQHERARHGGWMTTTVESEPARQAPDNVARITPDAHDSPN